MIRGALYGLEIGGSLVVVAAAGHQEDGQGEGIVFKVLIFVKIRGAIEVILVLGLWSRQGEGVKSKDDRNQNALAFGRPLMATVQYPVLAWINPGT